MRVLIVNTTGADEWHGGVERGIALARGELLSRGVDVALLQTTPAEGDGADRVEVLPLLPDGSVRRRIQNRVVDFVATPSKRLDGLVRDFDPDVIHTHNLPGITTAVWRVAQKQRVPLVHSLHDYYLLCPRVSLMTRDGEPCGNHALCRLRAARLARWAPAVSVVTGVSEAVLEAHRSVFPGARLQVLRNPMVAYGGVVMRPPSRDPITVGYIGSLTHEKGILPLLQAAAQLVDDTRFRFRIAGHGRLQREVRASAESLPNVTFLGSVQRKAKDEFVQACDVGVIPSVWAEPGGPTHGLIEWLTARRPVLVSLRGGLAEVAGLLPGTITIEPTAESIVARLRELASSAAWSEVVSAAGEWDASAELAGWIETQIDIYQQLYAARSGRHAAPVS